MAARAYKVILVGESATGKTTWLKNIRTGEFDRKYVATVGVEVHSVHVDYMENHVTFNVWDIAGQEIFGHRDAYYTGADCAMVFHDLSCPDTFNIVSKWIEDIKRICPHIPIVIVGTKSNHTDAKPRMYPNFINYSLSTETSTKEEKLAPLVALASLYN